MTYIAFVYLKYIRIFFYMEFDFIDQSLCKWLVIGSPFSRLFVSVVRSPGVPPFAFFRLTLFSVSIILYSTISASYINVTK